jgi:mannose-6-phosphate isomerase
MVVLLENPVRSYAWGSPTVIPELLGREPSGEPQAELWVGAHAGSPSTVVDDGRTLDRFIAADPDSALGESGCERFGPALPFLLKVLAVQRPLSIQAHPNLEQAAAGYAAENAAGIPIDSPQRSYRDRNHKPELALALTDFEALLGFAEPADIVAALEAFGHADLDAAADVIRAGGGLATLVRRWLTLGSDETDRLVTEVAKIAAQRPADDPFALVSRLAEEYPGDRGVLIALLMRHLRLRPGEAVFVPAGVPHAYLSGVAVEAQASSDNTVRAGLTPKHVDAAEVMRLLRYEAYGVAVVPTPGGRGERVYIAPGVSEFRMSRVELSTEGLELPAGPCLILLLDGWADVSSGASHCRLQRGRAAFVQAAEPDPRLAGRGVAVTVTTALDTAG